MRPRLTAFFADENGCMTARSTIIRALQAECDAIAAETHGQDGRA